MGRERERERESQIDVDICYDLWVFATQVGICYGSKYGGWVFVTYRQVFPTASYTHREYLLRLQHVATAAYTHFEYLLQLQLRYYPDMHFIAFFYGWVFVTIANTESRYLLRKGRYFPPHHIRIVSICYVCNTLLPRYVFYRVLLWNLRKMYSHATINLN